MKKENNVGQTDSPVSSLPLDAPENADLQQLRLFASRVMRQHRNDGMPGDVDGWELQEIAAACGLLAKIEVTEPCAPDVCVCAEYGDFPLTCYRDSAVLRRCHREDDAR